MLLGNAIKFQSLESVFIICWSVMLVGSKAYFYWGDLCGILFSDWNYTDLKSLGFFVSVFTVNQGEEKVSSHSYPFMLQ